MQDEYFREPFTGSTLLCHQEKLPILCIFYKKNIVQTSKRCFVCLKGSHLTKDCSSKIKCFKGSKRHHIALCESEESGHSGKSSSVTNIAGVDDNTKFLLQTAKVKVKSCENSYVNSARVLFDNCSQLSYITQQLRNRLKLKTVGTRKTLI